MWSHMGKEEGMSEEARRTDVDSVAFREDGRCLASPFTEDRAGGRSAFHSWLLDESVRALGVNTQTPVPPRLGGAVCELISLWDLLFSAEV